MNSEMVAQIDQVGERLVTVGRPRRRSGTIGADRAPGSARLPLALGEELGEERAQRAGADGLVQEPGAGARRRRGDRRVAVGGDDRRGRRVAEAARIAARASRPVPRSRWKSERTTSGSRRRGGRRPSAASGAARTRADQPPRRSVIAAAIAGSFSTRSTTRAGEGVAAGVAAGLRHRRGGARHADGEAAAGAGRASARRCGWPSRPARRSTMASPRPRPWPRSGVAPSSWWNSTKISRSLSAGMPTPVSQTSIDEVAAAAAAAERGCGRAGCSARR